MKACQRCGVVSDDFWAAKNRKDGLQAWCKHCRRAYQREKYIPRPWPGAEEREAKRRSDKMRYRYGITPEDYDALLLMQGGRCAGCGIVAARVGKRLDIDHDHACCDGNRRSCGRCVRGLLCHNCNIAAGFSLDNPHTLRSLAGYVENS